jgi:hypothetical protein
VNVCIFGDDEKSLGSRQRYKIGSFEFYRSQGVWWMISDQICWLDSRTIKRGHLLVLDWSLVPYCSKYLSECMRANYALSGFEKDHV